MLDERSPSSRLRKLRNDCLAGRVGEPILRSPTRKHVFIGRDGGAKPRQRPRLARQRRQSAGVLPSKILKTREFSALRRNTRFPRNVEFEPLTFFSHSRPTRPLPAGTSGTPKKLELRLQKGLDLAREGSVGVAAGPVEPRRDA